MDFPSVVRKYGEDTTRAALTTVCARARNIIRLRTESAVDGVLVMSPEDLQQDALLIACSLDDFPFSADEKCALIDKAWEIIGP